ncbi:hypothetical protein NXW59_22405, partial [Bacteroides fragilis]|nr:hypothetical protein [Bacteroides fragilis]
MYLRKPVLQQLHRKILERVKNTGFELALNHRNKIGAVNYSIGANIATNKNKITNLGGSDKHYQTLSYIVKYILKKENQSVHSWI